MQIGYKYSFGKKFGPNCSIWQCLPDKCCFAFYEKFKIAAKNCKFSLANGQMTLHIPSGPKIAPSRTISKISAFLCSTQKFKMAAINGGRMFFSKRAYDLCQKSAKIAGVAGEQLFEKNGQMTAYTLEAQKWAKDSLSCTISEINTFCDLCRNSK